jgi:hypothetical protein
MSQLPSSKIFMTICLLELLNFMLTDVPCYPLYDSHPVSLIRRLDQLAGDRIKTNASFPRHFTSRKLYTRQSDPSWLVGN